MKKIIKASLCLALVLAMLTGCTVVNVASAGEVNGEKISLGEYKYVLTLGQMYFSVIDEKNPLTPVCMYDSYVAQFVYTDISKLTSDAGKAEDGKTIWEKELSEGVTVGDKLKETVFDALTKLKLAVAKAAEMEVTLTDEEAAKITTAKNTIIEQLGSKTKLAEALKSVNMTEGELISLWTNIAIANKLKDQLTKEDSITDDTMKAYYDSNYICVKHILIKVGDDVKDLDAAKTKADEIIKSLNDGGDFEALMKENTDDVDQEGAPNGGDTGYVFKKGDFGNPAFEDASFALAEGEYTKEAVKVEGSSYSGYHIIKKYALPESYFTDNTNSIKDSIKTAVIADGYDKTIEGLKENAEITKKDGKIGRIKLIVLKDDKSTATDTGAAATEQPADTQAEGTTEE